MESSAARVARGSLVLMLGGAPKIPVALLTLAYIARMLSPTEMGILFAFEILTGLLRLVSDPGFSRAATTYCAEGVAKERNVRALIQRLALTGTALATIVSFTLFVAGATIMKPLVRTDIDPVLLQVLCLDVFLDCIGPYMEGMLLGLGDFKSLKFADTASFVVGQLAGVILVADGLGMIGVVLGWALGDGLYLVQTMLAVHRNVTRYATSPQFLPSSKELLNFAFPVFGSSLIEFGAGWFDRIFILAMFPIEMLAIYNVAYSIFKAVSGLPAAVSEALLPHLARQYARGGKRVLQNESGDAARYISVLFAPVLLGVAGISSSTIVLVAGSGYYEGAILLTVFCGFRALTLPGFGFEQVFYVTKKTRVYAFAAAAAATGGALLSGALSSPFGTSGIAVAKGATLLLVFLVEYWSLRAVVSLEIDLSSFTKILLCGTAMAMVVYVVQQAYYSVELWLAYVFIGALVYVGLVRAMRLTRKRDFDVTKELLGPRFRRLVDIAEGLIRPAQ
jgi:O-antigen/teichoic acid export membrane protein